MLTRTDIERYFNAEKNESLLFICMGITAVVVALILFFYFKKNWCKGAAIPLLVIGLVHLVAGTVVFNRSDKDRMRIVYAYDMNPSVLQTKEIPRMEQVNKSFRVYRYIEMAFILAGLTLVLFSIKKTGKSFWAGLGTALVLEAVISLTAGYFAEKRSVTYEQQLKEWIRHPQKAG